MTSYQKTAWAILGAFGCSTGVAAVWVGWEAILVLCAVNALAWVTLRPWERVEFAKTAQRQTLASVELFHNLIDEGYILEANRMFFHPRGLALCVVYNDKMVPIRLDMYDHRHDPEGLIFGDWSPELLEKIAKQELLRNTLMPGRIKAIGHWIEPRPHTSIAPPPPSRQDCAYCGEEISGEPEFTIHRDGFCEGPEVPLCVNCGGSESPDCEEIWDVISEANP